MKLLTQEIIEALPKLYTHENTPPEEVPVAVKFFTPWGGASWYATEGEEVVIDDDTEEGAKDWRFFGWANLSGRADDPDAELGYFHLSQLEELRGPGGLKVERDRHFKATLAQVMKGERQ